MEGGNGLTFKQAIMSDANYIFNNTEPGDEDHWNGWFEGIKWTLEHLTDEGNPLEP